MSDVATEEITLAELLEMAITSRLIDVHTSMPAIVVSFDSDAQTVTVTPVLNRALPDGAGNWIGEALPQIADVPIRYARSKKFTGGTFPLEKGDMGALVFCERNIGAWRSTGNAGDPGDLGMHTLDGAFFLPGLFDDANPSAALTTDGVTFGSETDVRGRIQCKAAAIKVGMGTGHAAARQGDNLTASAGLGTWAGAVEQALLTAGSPIDPMKTYTIEVAPDGALGAVNGHSATVTIGD